MRGLEVLEWEDGCQRRSSHEVIFFKKVEKGQERWIWIDSDIWLFQSVSISICFFCSRALGKLCYKKWDLLHL